jgi:S1-C subfamily serine protease
MRLTHTASIVVLVAVAALASRPASHKAQPANHAVIVSTLLSGTVRVNVPGAHGSGACRRLSDGSAWVWTCAHVASHCRSTIVDPTGAAPDKVEFVPAEVVFVHRQADGRQVRRSRYAATVARIDESLDVALLRITSPTDTDPGSLDFSPSPPMPGDTVYAAGSPKGLDGTWSAGVFVLPGHKGDHGEMDQAQLATLPGSSGGPVVGPDGRVCGLVRGGPGEAFTLMVSARSIRSWADTNGVLFAFEGRTPGTVPGGPVDVTPPPQAP